jgi:predicted nucleic acid-binding Zn ribbon protein
MTARERGRVRRVGSVLDRVLAGLGVDEVVDRHRVLVDWKGRVGEEIARATRPRRLDGDVLIVGVCSPAWLNELSLRRTEILKALNAGQGRGKIRKIVYRLDPEIDG